ncbi:phospholipid:diacylglycerol acyltransferase 1-like protein [Tanacetum coccineum]
MVEINGGEKTVIIPHSMGVLYFLHFLKWVEAPVPMGGGGGPEWCAKHIKAVMNIGRSLLGAPKALAGRFSAEAKDIAFARGIAPGVLDSDVFHIQTLQHMMRMSRTWDSTMSMIPKGGETIWGGLDWSPEEDLLEFVASKMMERRNVHYSHGLADDLNDPKYQHYKYWSNALETKLLNAPDMEIYSMYSVGIATERAYVYKLTPQTECYIPFQIDNTAGDTNSHVCLKDGVYTIDIHKSNIYGIGVNKDEVLSMASNAGCIAGDIPFNYLGLPIGSNMKSIAS